MNERAADTRSVIVERDFPFPPEKIWRALTERHLIEEWLMENDFVSVVGHRFNLRRSPQPGMNIVVDCEVRIVEPNKTLSYTWDAMGLASVVTWTLTPIAAGTRLRMEQAGFRADQRQAFGGAMAGWRQFFAKLEKLLARAG